MALRVAENVCRHPYTVKWLQLQISVVLSKFVLQCSYDYGTTGSFTSL